MVRPPEEIHSRYGPPSGSGPNRACQWPSEPTVAVSSRVARLTLAWALVSPSPQTQIATFLGEGLTERDAVKRANLYAGLSTTGIGTQKSFYDRARYDAAWDASSRV